MALLFCFVVFGSSLHSFSKTLDINLGKVIHTNLLKVPHDLLNRYKIINQYGETKKLAISLYSINLHLFLIEWLAFQKDQNL